MYKSIPRNYSTLTIVEIERDEKEKRKRKDEIGNEEIR
jgi:hypothetical protein